MNNKDEKKIRFGGWNHPDYKYMRRKFEKFWRDEIQMEDDKEIKLPFTVKINDPSPDAEKLPYLYTGTEEIFYDNVEDLF